MKIIAALLLLCLGSSAAAEYRAALFLPRSSYFWERIETFAQAAADDLGLRLDIYQADESPEKMLAQVRQAAGDGVDAIMFIEYRGIGETILQIAEQHKIPALLFNSGLDNSALLPRIQYPHWIGGVVPDDRQAGVRLITQLLGEAEKKGAQHFRVLAYSGFEGTRAHTRRFEGLKSIIEARSDVTLVESIPDVRDPALAADNFAATIQAHPEINIVWSYYDQLALAAAQRAQALNLTEPPVFGGIDWSPESLDGVEAGLLAVDIGGHIFDAAQSIIMLFDYLNGHDFADEQLLFDSNMLAATPQNSARFQQVLSVPESIDYKALSKTLNPELKQYHFDLDTLVEKAILPVYLTRQERLWLKDHRTLRIGIDPLWPPVEYFDDQGRYQGMSSDIIDDMAKRLGVKIEVVTGLSWPEVHEQIKRGEIDVLPAVSPTAKRQSYLNFTQPYLEFPQVIFIHDQVSLFINGLDDLRGHTVVIEKGYSSAEKLATDYPEINLLKVDTTLDALTMLALGKVDAYVGNLTIGSYVMTEHGLTNIKVAAPTPYSNELTFGVRKDWPELVPILQKTLDSLGPARMAEIRQKWMAVRYEHQVDYTKLWWIAGIALATLAAISTWLAYTKHINRVLHQQRERLRLTLESANLGSWEIFLHDMTPVSGVWNNYFAQHHGIKAPQKMNSMDDFYQEVDPGFRAELKTAFTRYLSGQSAHFEQEYKTNHGQWVLSQGRVFEHDQNGAPTRIIGTSQDITIRKNAQLEREKIHALLADALESIDAAFAMFDAQANFVICNMKYREIHPELSDLLLPGTHYVELLTKSGEVLKANEPAGQSVAEWVQAQWLSFHAQRKNWIEEYNGRWMLTRDYPTSDGGTVTLTYDITELKHTQNALEIAKNATEQANNELLAANKKLHELDQLKSMFIASISHELRTPLNSIIGFSSMMVRESFGPLSAKYKDYVTRINNSGQHLLSLITDIIDISKIESGRIDLRPSRFDVSELVDEAIASMHRLADTKGLKLEVVRSAPITLQTDKRRLLQCLLNLLSNAIKYSEQGTIRVSAEPQGESVLFSVQDSGIGITEQDMPRLFEAFERMESHLQVKAGGTGLGLYLTKKIVTELLQGQIGAESTVNVGSRFWFKVPTTLLLKNPVVIEPS